jgi:hypothetical protein
MGEEWKGRGGQRVRLLKEELTQYKDDEKKILMFTDR